MIRIGFHPASAAPLQEFFNMRNRTSDVSLKCKDSGVCICLESLVRCDKLEMLTVYKRFQPDVFANLPPLLSTDPSFIHVQLIPDSAERNDDKLYFFFREKSSEMGQTPVTQSRIGRICLVCTQREACLFCGVNIMKRKPASIWKTGPETPRGESPAVFECLRVPNQCLANADVLESTCVFNLPVYNASLCLWDRPLTSDPVILWPLLPGSPTTLEGLSVHGGLLKKNKKYSRVPPPQNPVS